MRRLALLALSGLLLAAPLDAQTSVRAITLSTAGLAMIEAEGPLGGAPLRLSVARADIDDFLKSLMVMDPAGGVASITLTGPGSFEDAFAHLPIGPDDVTDPARLMAAMRGAPVRVERRGEGWSGTILGVAQRPAEHGPVPVLSLREADGTIRTVELSDATTLTLSDPDDRAILDAALAAIRRGANPRRVAVALASDRTEAREAGLVWLQSAPVWRTAWRAVDDPDGLRLIGWAVVENTTGLDWEGVRLTLATGALRAIEAQLYARVMAPREQAEVPRPQMLARSAVGMAMPAPMMMEAMGDMAVATAAGDDGATFSRFTLETPVTLPAGEMLSLPFLSQVLPDARLTLWRGGQGGRHPEIALALTNPLPLRLPAGVLTLYEPGRGHAGDAMIPELAPGATEIVRIGLDTALEIREESTGTETLRELRLSGGLLSITEEVQMRTTYRIEGPAAGERVVTIDHPRRAGWTVVSHTGPIVRPDAWRWQIGVGAGERASLTVTERQPRQRRIAVADLDTALLIDWAGRSPDPALAERLREMADRRRQITAIEQEIRRSEAESQAAEREQARLVNLIVQLGDDSAANRDRRARVDAIDADLAAAAARRAALADDLAGLRAALAMLIEG
jgi:hypothetical protein